MELKRVSEENLKVQRDFRDYKQQVQKRVPLKFKWLILKII